MTGRRSDHDVIVVGARAAGAATAMLLARHGWRVLALERAARGADTVSTHALMRAGVVLLHRWGLLDAVVAAGTPPVRQTIFHYDDESVTVPFTPGAGIDALFAPRRTVLDPILADGAIAAGADLRFGAAVDSVVRERDGRVVGVAGRWPGGGRFRARAPIVIGADGARSLVARSVAASEIVRTRHAGSVVYAYFEAGAGDFEAYEWSYRPGATAGVMPTNDGVLAWVGMPRARFDGEVRHDVESGFWRLLAGAAPELRPRLAARARTSRFHVHRGRPGFLRRSAGPGWALVGDASHFTDPLSTHGLTDAFRDAELLARAVDDGLRHPARMAEALDGYQRESDRVARPLLAAADVVASYRWTMDDIRAHLVALSGAMRPTLDVVLGFDRVSA